MKMRGSCSQASIGSARQALFMYTSSLSLTEPGPDGNFDMLTAMRHEQRFRCIGEVTGVYGVSADSSSSINREADDGLQHSAF